MEKDNAESKVQSAVNEAKSSITLAENQGSDD